MEKFEIGTHIELVSPYREYRFGEIVGFNGLKYVVEFSSGMQACFWEDEFVD